MNKNNVYAVLAQNSICVICWVILAVCFDRWWIALFALLFMSSCVTVPVHYRICDKCGKHGPEARSVKESIDKAVLAGWKHISESNKDYCPNCYVDDSQAE